MATIILPSVNAGARGAVAFWSGRTGHGTGDCQNGMFVTPDGPNGMFHIKQLDTYAKLLFHIR